VRPASRLAALTLLACGACATRTPRVVGFHGVPWGAGQEALVSALGTPWQITPRRDSLVYVEFRAEVLGGQMAEPFALVHRDSGMIAGGYTVRVRRYDASCEAAFDSVFTKIRADHPGTDHHRSQHGPSQAPFCPAVRAGQGRLHGLLRDRANEARVLVALQPGHDFLRVTFASREGVRRGLATPPKLTTDR
jgi:hypothetical protein